MSYQTFEQLTQEVEESASHVMRRPFLRWAAMSTNPAVRSWFVDLLRETGADARLIAAWSPEQRLAHLLRTLERLPAETQLLLRQPWLLLEKMYSQGRLAAYKEMAAMDGDIKAHATSEFYKLKTEAT